MTRKASDILLNVESYLQTVVKFMQNIDNNQKLLLDKVNKLTADLKKLQGDEKQFVAKPIPQPQASLQTQPAFYQSGKKIFSAEALEKPPQSDQQVFVGHPVQEQSYELDNYGQPELMEEVIHTGQRRTTRGGQGGDSSTKKVAVSQRITFPNGTAVFLATITIFDLQAAQEKKKQTPIKRIRTNSHGRWLTSLDPGEYRVHVLKRLGAETKKPPIELNFKIQVPESDSPVELPTPELPEIYAN